MKPLMKYAMLWGLMLIFAGTALASKHTEATNTAQDAENIVREVIYLSEKERALVLLEMRHFLEAVHLILDAALREDMMAVDKIARPLGMQALRAAPASLHKKLPKGFTLLGPKVHQQFQAIADDARDLGDPAYTIQQVKTLTGQCLACHRMYELKSQN